MIYKGLTNKHVTEPATQFKEVRLRSHRKWRATRDSTKFRLGRTDGSQSGRSAATVAFDFRSQNKRIPSSEDFIWKPPVAVVRLLTDGRAGHEETTTAPASVTTTAASLCERVRIYDACALGCLRAQHEVAAGQWSATDQYAGEHAERQLWPHQRRIERTF